MERKRPPIGKGQIKVYNGAQDGKLAKRSMAQSCGERRRSNTRAERRRSHSRDTRHLPYKIPTRIEIVQQLYPLKRDTSETDVDVIFFHGLHRHPGDQLWKSSWVQRGNSGVCWPQKWLPEDLHGRVRVLSLEYDAQVMECGGRGNIEEVDHIASNLRHVLVNSPRWKFGQGRPVVLVGHSFGGLVIKSLVVEVHRASLQESVGKSSDKESVVSARAFMTSLKGIVFYGVPHAGANMGEILRLWSIELGIRTAAIVQNFEPLQKKMESLSGEFDDIVSSKELIVYAFGEGRPMEMGQPLVVEYASVERLSRHNNYKVEDANHLEVCQPPGKTHSSYVKLLDVLKLCIRKAQYERVAHLRHRDFVVGLEPLVKKVMDMLKLEELKGGQLNLGVVGMGGLGKTTLVEEVFELVRTDYPAHYFLVDVRERSLKGSDGIVELQRELLWGLAKYEGEVKNVNHGKAIIRELLTGLKVFLVLDDVDNEDDLDAFLINKKIFGDGSKVIVTSRNWDALRRHDESMHRFDMELLGMDRAMELFCFHAFREKSPKQEFQEIVKEVVVACGGLPLSLVSMGAYLRLEPASQWHGVLMKLKNAEAVDGGGRKDSKLWRSLRISVDRLGMEEKDLFLDIVCFFNKNENVSCNTLSHIWGSMIELQHLIGRSMVKISEEGDLLVVHDQLRDLGRKIVEEESPYFPGKRSRLWDAEVANEAFATKKLSKNVRGLALEGPWESFPRWRKGPISEEDYDEHCVAPTHEMPLLKYLTLTNVSNETLKWVLHCHPRSLGWLFVKETDYETWESAGEVWKRKRSLQVIPSSIGELRNLRVLRLEGCKELKEVPEFLGRLTMLQELEMIHLPLIESLPASIGSLSRLTSLDLFGCGSLAAVPESTGQLTNLTSLDLAGCGSLAAMPWTIGELTNLTSLDLSGCVSLAALPVFVGNLNNLTSLDLSGCGNLAALPESIGQLTNLTTLDLSGCGRLAALPESIGQLTYLMNLALYGCGSLASLPKSIGQLTNLLSLDLSGCGSLAALPESLGALTNLTSLDLSACESLAALPWSIKELTNLTSLDLSGCGRLATLESLGALTNLTSLDLSACESLAALPLSIGELTNLTSLDLSGCGSLATVPESLGALTNLTSLDLSAFETLAALPWFIGELTILTSLALSRCGSLAALPDFVGNLNNLTCLDMSGCGNLAAIPESTGQLTNLTSLDLSGCGNLAAIPESTGQLTNLTSLDLSGCGNLAAIPESTGQLTNLTSLDLSGCGNLAAIPESTGQLTNLTSLDLSGCGNLAAIPESTGQLTNLTSLDLSGCGNLAAISESTGQLTNLTSLDLSGCGNLAAIPESTGQLTNLTSLDLSECGSLVFLPESIGQLTNLTSLTLFGCGSLAAVPESVGQLTNITSLSLSACGSLGALPESIGQLTNLSSLDFSRCGNLEAIPESLGQLTNLTSLDLSGCGNLAAIPESTGQLTNLTSLDLYECGSLLFLPESIGQLTNLTSLTLFGCGSLVALHGFVGKLTNLTSLDLSGCGSLAALPESVGQLTNLTSLDLSECRSLAALPESLGHLTNLTNVALYGCESLAMLESIRQLTNLTSLDLIESFRFLSNDCDKPALLSMISNAPMQFKANISIGLQDRLYARLLLETLNMLKDEILLNSSEGISILLRAEMKSITDMIGMFEVSVSHSPDPASGGDVMIVGSVQDSHIRLLFATKEAMVQTVGVGLENAIVVLTTSFEIHVGVISESEWRVLWDQDCGRASSTGLAMEVAKSRAPQEKVHPSCFSASEQAERFGVGLQQGCREVEGLNMVLDYGEHVHATPIVWEVGRFLMIQKLLFMCDTGMSHGEPSMSRPVPTCDWDNAEWWKRWPFEWCSIDMFGNHSGQGGNTNVASCSTDCVPQSERASISQTKRGGSGANNKTKRGDHSGSGGGEDADKVREVGQRCSSGSGGEGGKERDNDKETDVSDNVHDYRGKGGDKGGDWRNGSDDPSGDPNEKDEPVVVVAGGCGWWWLLVMVVVAFVGGWWWWRWWRLLVGGGGWWWLPVVVVAGCGGCRLWWQ